MMRKRLGGFLLGFSLTGAAITHFIYKDLWTDRESLSYQLKQQFDALDARVSKLEPVLPDIPHSNQGESNLN